MPLSPAEAMAGSQGIERTVKVEANEIPIIDVSALVRRDSEGEQAVVSEMAEAFREIGFCYIANHGIPQKLIDRAFAAMPVFFSQPEEEKAKVPINRNQRGWLGMHGQVQLHGKKPNRSESFIFGLDLPEDDPDRVAGHPLHDANKWPEALPEFRATMEEYWRALRLLAPKLMRGLALAMRQPDDFFVPMFQKPASLIRCVTYPPSEGEFDGVFGSGPHTDTGALTILAQDDVGGLQLRKLDGTWIDAPTIPGTFVVNIGDMVMRWTNGHFRSTPHRVVSSGKQRYSMPFFFSPDWNARIETLPEFCSEENPSRFPPVVWHEFVVRSYAAQYSQFKKEA